MTISIGSVLHLIAVVVFAIAAFLGLTDASADVSLIGLVALGLGFHAAGHLVP